MADYTVPLELPKGVLSLDDFKITYNGNMSITIGCGSAWHNGHLITFSQQLIEFDTVETTKYIALSVAYASNGSFSLIEEQSETSIVPGNVPLYTIQINPDTTQILSSNVTDHRSICNFGEFLIVTENDILEPIGLKVADIKIDILPQTKDNEEEIPGRHGSIDFGTTLGKRLAELTVFTPDGLSFLEKEELKRECARYFNPMAGEKKLVIVKDPSIYYNVKYSGKISLDNYPSWFSFVLPFKMNNPFKYSTIQKVHTGNGNLVNNGSFETGLIIEIEGPVSSVSFSVGGETLSYSESIGIGSKLVVDTLSKTAKIDSEDAEDKWNGKYPLLQLGTTYVSAASDSVTFKWREWYL